MRALPTEPVKIASRTVDIAGAGHFWRAAGRLGFRRLVAGGPVPALESVQLVELVLQLLVECESLFEHVGSHKRERQRFLMTTGEISTIQDTRMERACQAPTLAAKKLQ